MRILSGATAVAWSRAAGGSRRWLPTILAAATLGLLALGSGALWRAELEAQGWDGTRWIYRTHLAFPIAMAAFVAWTITVGVAAHGVRGARLAILAVLHVAIAAAGYFAIRAVLLFAFGGFGGGLLSVAIVTEPQHLPDVPAFLAKPFAGEVLLRDLVFWSVWLTPTLCVWASLRAGGIRSPIWSVPISAMLQFWAWPLSIWLLALTDHRGGADPEHAIKSGFLVPWLVVAVGLPLVATPPSAAPAKSGAELVG